MSAIDFAFPLPGSIAVPLQAGRDGSDLFERFEALTRVARSLAFLEPKDLFRQLIPALRPIFDFEFIDIVVFEDGTNEVQWRSSSGKSPIEETSLRAVYHNMQALWIADDYDVHGQADPAEELKQYRSLCCLPLRTPLGPLGVLTLAGIQPHEYSEEETRWLNLAADHVALSIAHSRSHEARDNFDNSKQIPVRAANSTEYPTMQSQVFKSREEIVGVPQVEVCKVRSEANVEGIVGQSATLQRAMREVEVVAPTNSTVLIEGETGTGKELFAQAIHNRSKRRDRAFVKLNCAAIPLGLLESELFGHEKGAFTGAIARKAGRFEIADGGTLFLDEVGDIPLELQPKLLRVLQEREFEKLGSTRTQQVNVRVIAATHRNLQKMVEDGKFRSDLYYRLNVFPIVVPPLRERRDDIPLVVHHYVDKFSRRMNRGIESIPTYALKALMNYSWPGNVRELQNFVERSVILSTGKTLQTPLAELKNSPVLDPSSGNPSTLQQLEREQILRALRESNWITGGPGGAAAKLGMKRTTLAYRIRKLQIPCRPD